MKFRKKSILLNMTVHMITVFSFITLLGSSIYFLSMKSYFTGQFISYNQQILKQSVSTYEIFLNSTIEAAMVYMEEESANDTDLETMTPYAYENQIYERLNNVAKITDFIYSVYYFEHEPESIYLSSGLRFDSNDFYDKSFIDTLDYSRNYYILPARQLPTLDSGTKDILPIVISLPLNSPTYDCTYVINLDANRLFNYLIKNSAFDERLTLKIVDSKDMILASSYSVSDLFQKLEVFSPALSYEKQEDSIICSLNGRKKLVSYIQSTQFDWKYIGYIDYSLIFDDMLKPLKVILLIALSSLTASIAVSFYMSKKFYRPVKDIVGILDNRQPLSHSGNEYDFIRDSLNRYLEENNQFKEIICQNKAALKKQFFYSLVVLNTYTGKDISEKAGDYGLDLLPNIIVLVISIDQEETYFKQFDMDNRILLELSMENMAVSALSGYGKGFFVNFESGKFALVLSMEKGTREGSAEKAASDLAYQLKETCKSLMKFTLTIGIGRMKESLELINTSFKEAMKALTFKESIGCDEIISYREVVMATSASVIYSRELENSLVQSLLMGDSIKAKNLLYSLFEGMNSQKMVLPFHLHTFSVRLLNSLMKLVVEMGLSEEDMVFGGQPFSVLMENIIKTNNETTCIALFSQILDGIGNLVISKRTIATNEHVKQMMDYIEHHYSQTISLDIIADYIQLNRCYAGRIFKQSTNLSIVDYVNQVRIKKATELLEKTDLKISEIAERAGFSNTNYFIQIFKKIMHVTPGQYKDRTVTG